MPRSQIGSVWETPNQIGDASSIALPSRNISAGSLVVVAVRYESVSATVTLSDTAGGTWQVQQAFNTNVGVALAWSYNHPGGTGVVITATFSAARAYRNIAAIELDGSDAANPAQLGAIVTSAATLNHSMAVTTPCDIFAVQGNYNAGTYAASSPAIGLTPTNSALFFFSTRRDVATSPATIANTGGSGNASSISLAFSYPASSDTTAPTFTGSITVGAKTSSTIALTLPTATDNVAVTGYEYRVDGGAWVDNGNSTAVALSGLAALTSYTIDARAYDAAANVSSALSVTTSTYRAGASAGSIRTATGPQDGNPAGLLYAFCELLPTSDWVSYSIVSGPTPSGGTLDAQPNGAFSYTGPAPATLVIQPEVNGAASGDPITVTLYDQTVELVADNISAGSAIGGGAVQEVPSLAADGLVFALDLSTGAVTPVSMGWPARGVRAIVSPGGVDPEPVKVFEQYSFDREVYEVDFEAKYLAGLDDAADELQAFAVPATVPAEGRVAVGQALESGVVMFAVGPNVPVGLHEVLVKIGTAGGRTKGVIVQIKVDR